MIYIHIYIYIYTYIYIHIYIYIYTYTYIHIYIYIISYHIISYHIISYHIIFNIISHHFHFHFQYIHIYHISTISSIFITSSHEGLPSRPSRDQQLLGRSLHPRGLLWWSAAAATGAATVHGNFDGDFRAQIVTGWWFGTFFIFPYIGNNHPNWLIFFRGVQTTNQVTSWWWISWCLNGQMDMKNRMNRMGIFHGDFMEIFQRQNQCGFIGDLMRFRGTNGGLTSD